MKKTVISALWALENDRRITIYQIKWAKFKRP